MRILLGVTVALATACSKKAEPPARPPPAPDAAPRPDPAAPWLAKLATPADAERAVTELEVLCDPKAIAPIGEAWRRDGRPARYLQVLIRLARPLTPAEAASKYCEAYTTSGRPSSWPDALPYLKAAITELDPATDDGIDTGELAAAALGEAGDLEAARILVQTVEQALPPDVKAHKVRLAAALALARYPNAESIATLAEVIRAPADRQPAQVPGAAIVALGEMQHPDALPVLIEAMYRWPVHFVKTRRAMLTAGGDVAGALRRVLRGEDAAVNAIVDEVDGDEPTSARDFSAAYILGDLRPVDAVPDLVAALGTPARPGYVQDGFPGPPSHVTILDALRKIGEPSVAPHLLAIAEDGKRPVEVRAFALRALGQLAPPPSGEPLAALHRLAKSKEGELLLAAEEALRHAAVDEASAALVTDRAGIELAARCAGDGACLIAAFDGADDDATRSARVRAALELRRLGPAAAAHLPRLLDEVADADPLVRQAVLLAITRIAAHPCADCVAKLDAVLEADRPHQALASLSFETELVKLYFARGLR